MAYRFDLNGQSCELDVLARRPDLRLALDGSAFNVSEQPGTGGAFSLLVNGQSVQGWRLVVGDDIYLRIAGRNIHLRRQSEAGDAAQAGAAANEILADMPGTVISLHAAPGQEVAEGDKLLVIESMKLQMSILAPRAGRIAKLHVTENATFDRGAVLISFGDAA
ncbi:biotin/lipoyl-containing protein [Ferrovibrio sp.]|uniref:acetyl-CoA carboxylase biotin carboxyl carrier protein subunit n=1 Tax=Ferrovibrio sp. TaxID=1917215 RepID=UPI001B6AFFC3|nr:biotin/lipoyl-containing protein [Ferrovibrio sp.]MBP7063867.1 acetyl-CoA carboxylase biotin carboxyl carrier protein subunit [Ferrovibrio sp.]